MSDTVSIETFRRAIQTLPSDEPRENSTVWYRTQKEHWRGWLGEYHGPGAYGRQPDPKRDARFAYNHIVCPQMLLWLIEASGVDGALVAAAHESASSGATLMARSGAIRRHVPWETLRQALSPPLSTQSHHSRLPAASEHRSIAANHVIRHVAGVSQSRGSD
jgi:hypothetical protein